MQYTIFAASLPACSRPRASFSLKGLTTPASNPWEKLQPELIALNQRLLVWQQQVKSELGKLLDPAKAAAGDYDHEQQHHALRQAMARAGDGPRRDLNDVIDRLCVVYLAASAGEREEIRQFLGKQAYILHDLWGYIHRAAEQVRAGGGEQWLRFGAAVASMEDLRGDEQDTLAGLGDLYLAAAEAELHPDRVFHDVAELSTEPPNSETSIRELLRDFEKTEYFLQAVQPELARHARRG
jgi:hypothetical protein